MKDEFQAIKLGVIDALMSYYRALNMRAKHEDFEDLIIIPWNPNFTEIK